MVRLVLAALALALTGCEFSPTIDDGAFVCAADQSCPPGFVCAADHHCRRPGEELDAGHRDDLAPACPSQTCAARGYNCGQATDGCGAMLTCGPVTCGLPPGDHCGGGGANICGKNNCKPTSCMAAGANCGLLSDGCSTVLSCGSCIAPQRCGGGGKANVCG